MRIFGRIMAFMVMATIAMAFLTSCDKDDDPGEYDNVMIFYSAGFNSLSEYMRADLNDLKSGYIPGRKSKDAILVISKITKTRNDYSTETQPYLLRLAKNRNGEVAVDSVMAMPYGTILADKGTLNEFLCEIKDRFPAKHYGLVVSSHATGWLPCYYFANPSKFEGSGSGGLFRQKVYDTMDKLQPYVEPYRDPSLPAVKSITQEIETIDNVFYSHEMDIKDFAEAIPMHLDYLLFDACLMGGIEVAYQMKDVTDYIGFSQTEVLADGYDYATLSRHLLLENDPQAVCEDFFESYDSRSGSARSATVSYVDCTKLGSLTSVCSELFEKYRDEIANVNPDKVQAYFYDWTRHWHYDLYDIVAKSGASEEDLAKLQDALDECVLYNAATPSFFDLIINSHCGFSMYLPADGSAYLDGYYKSLAWNKATSLVR